MICQVRLTLKGLWHNITNIFDLFIHYKLSERKIEKVEEYFHGPDLNETAEKHWIHKLLMMCEIIYNPLDNPNPKINVHQRGGFLLTKNKKSLADGSLHKLNWLSNSAHH